LVNIIGSDSAIHASLMALAAPSVRKYSNKFGISLAYSYLCTRYGTANRNRNLKPKRRGFHLVTSEIMSQLPKLPKTGIVNIFTKHTSCGLSINENCDPDVRVDMETIFNRLVPENRPEYEHTLEGADDMPAHAKSTLSGVSITIPITDGRLNLGTWQGIYFCEYRNYGGARELVVTIIGE